MAIDYKPLNLGQGFPDYPPPQYIMDTLGQVATKSDPILHQYTRGFVSSISQYKFIAMQKIARLLHKSDTTQNSHSHELIS